MDDRSIKSKGRKVYVLESKEFHLKQDALLSFDLYRRSNAISLQVGDLIQFYLHFIRYALIRWSTVCMRLLLSSLLVIGDSMKLFNC